MAPVAGHRWGCHFCPWATAVQLQLRLVSRKLAIGAGGLLVREQGALTRYRRFWVREADTWTDKISTARSGNSPAGYRNGLPETRSSAGALNGSAQHFFVIDEGGCGGSWLCAVGLATDGCD